MSPSKVKEKEFVWNHFTKPTVNKKAPMEPTSGQGDSSTIWKGCAMVFDMFYKCLT